MPGVFRDRRTRRPAGGKNEPPGNRAGQATTEEPHTMTRPRAVPNSPARPAAAGVPTDFTVIGAGIVGLATAYTRMEGLRRQCAARRVALGGEALRFTSARTLAWP